MKRIYEGKTKDVYKNDDGTNTLYFKDDMTGKEGVFDPGENQVGLTVEGAGRSGLAVSTYFFEELNKKKIPTHFIESNLEKNTMTVKPIQVFGQGIEVICRYKAAGSFLRRFGAYAAEGDDLNAYVEVSLKDDDRQDPFINSDALGLLQILEKSDYEKIKVLTQEISGVVRDLLSDKGLTLYDIKLEFGQDLETEEILLIDEISGGNMRVYKEGHSIQPLDLGKYILG